MTNLKVTISINAIITTNDSLLMRVITRLPNSEQSYKGKVKTQNKISTLEMIVLSIHVKINNIMQII